MSFVLGDGSPTGVHSHRKRISPLRSCSTHYGDPNQRRRYRLVGLLLIVCFIKENARDISHHSFKYSKFTRSPGRMPFRYKSSEVTTVDSSRADICSRPQSLRDAEYRTCEYGSTFRPYSVNILPKCGEAVAAKGRPLHENTLRRQEHLRHWHQHPQYHPKEKSNRLDKRIRGIDSDIT